MVSAIGSESTLADVDDAAEDDSTGFSLAVVEELVKVVSDDVETVLSELLETTEDVLDVLLDDDELSELLDCSEDDDVLSELLEVSEDVGVFSA